MESFANPCFRQVVFILFLIQIATFSVLRVECARGSVVSPGSGEMSGGGSASAATGSAGGHHVHGQATRDLISAHYRAAHQGHHHQDVDQNDDPVDDGIPMTGLDGGGGGGSSLSALEEDSLPMHKYIASGSAHVPAKTRVSRYSQTGYYNPVPGYASAFPASYSQYTNNDYSFRDSNPFFMDTYPAFNTERDRVREARDRIQTSPPAAHSHQTHRAPALQPSYIAIPYAAAVAGGGGREGYRSLQSHDNSISSASYGSSSGGGGGGDEYGDDGHGHGHGWSSQYSSKVNTNAIGLLGLMGLLSLLSNVLFLFTTTTTTTVAARKKRSTKPEESHLERSERVFMEILPHLMPVADAVDRVIPRDCTLRGVCAANRVLVTEYQFFGRSAGQKVTSAVVKLLADHDIPNKKEKQKSKKSSIATRLEKAGLQGRNGQKCEKLYPVCAALQKRTTPRLPFPIRMQDLPKLMDKVSKMTTSNRAGFPKGFHLKL